MNQQNEFSDEDDTSSINESESSTDREDFKLEILNLSRNDFTLIGRKLFQKLKNLRDLKLASNLILMIQSNSFESLTKLDSLDLSGNMLSSFNDPAIFKGLHKLKKLNLNNNQLEYLGHSVFAELDSLELLVLSGNKISKLDSSNTFKGLKSLKLIIFQLSDAVEVLPRGIFDPLIKLEKIYLPSKLKKIESYTFSNLKYLNLVSISGLGATNLHENTFYNLTSLTSLALMNGNLSRLEMGALTGLDNLQNLNLSKNRLEVFEYSNVRLENLDLAFNSLKTLKNLDFSLMPNLKLLDLNGNQFENEFNESFSSLKTLQTLILPSFNQLPLSQFKSLENLVSLENSNLYVAYFMPNMKALSKIRVDFKGTLPSGFNTSAMFNNMSTLTEIKLNGNGVQIHKLSSNSFTNLDELIKIEFSNLTLNELDSYAFSKLSKMSELDLSNLKINKIRKNSFNLMEKLKKLSIAQNNLDAFDSLAIFSDDLTRSAIEKLDLSQNKIKEFHSYNCVFCGMDSLIELDLSGNDEIQKFPHDLLKNLQKLSVLNLSMKQLRSFDSSILIDLKSFKTINLRGGGGGVTLL